MARIRTIKPEFPHSESLGRVSRDARLTFVLLWTIADDAGRLRGNSRMLASLLFPYDDDATKKIDGWLAELEREGSIRRYMVDGQSYLDIPKWLDHQKIDRPSKSKFPSFDDCSPNPREDSRILVGGVDQGVDQGVDLSMSDSQANADDMPVLKNGKAKFTADAQIVLEFLNEKANRRYRPVLVNLEMIAARMAEGATMQDCKSVIAKKTREWANDESMAQYLRPATLFNRMKFAQYVGELGA